MVYLVNFLANCLLKMIVSTNRNSDASSSVNTAITGAYLRAADLNVVVVDWSVGANTINYITARNRVSEVGICKFCTK